jgi:hypothetical protein
MERFALLWSPFAPPVHGACEGLAQVHRPQVLEYAEGQERRNVA